MPFRRMLLVARNYLYNASFLMLTRKFCSDENPKVYVLNVFFVHLNLWFYYAN